MAQSVDVDLLRRLELHAAESPYGSRSASPSYQNRVNACSDICFRRRHWSSVTLKSGYLLVSLFFYWLFTAITLCWLESSLEASHRLTDVSSLKRAEFLRRFAGFQYHLPVESGEWMRATRDLLMWYEQQLDEGGDAVSWNGSYTLALMGALGSTIGHLPGVGPPRLSVTGRLLVMLWSPLAVFLYYSCVWKFAKLLNALDGVWKLTVLISCAFGFVAFLLIEYMYSTVTMASVYRTFNILTTTGVHQSMTQTSPFVWLLMHFCFWTLVLFVYRHYLDWRTGLCERVVATVPLDDLLQLRGQSGSYLLAVYRRRSLLTRLESMFMSDVDVHRIDALASHIRKSRHCTTVQTDTFSTSVV